MTDKPRTQTYYTITRLRTHGIQAHEGRIITDDNGAECLLIVGGPDDGLGITYFETYAAARDAAQTRIENAKKEIKKNLGSLRAQWDAFDSISLEDPGGASKGQTVKWVVATLSQLSAANPHRPDLTYARGEVAVDKYGASVFIYEKKNGCLSEVSCASCWDTREEAEASLAMRRDQVRAELREGYETARAVCGAKKQRLDAFEKKARIVHNLVPKKKVRASS